MLNIIRVCFSRGEEVKYISHLDMVKVFERAQRRAGIPIAYSQGFNPHPQMVFGLPLSVGVTSQAEYADFEFTEQLDPKEFAERLNKALPKGLKILDVKARQSKENIMASIGAASYDVLLSSVEKTPTELLKKSIEEFMQKQCIIVKKEGKHGSKDVDIRQMILDIAPKELKLENINASENKSSETNHNINTVSNISSAYLLKYIDRTKNPEILRPSYSIENIYCLSMKLSAGSVANLKAELLVSALGEFFDNGTRLVKIHRTRLFVNNGGELIEPLDDSIL